MAFSISVQEQDFDVGAEYQQLIERHTGAGAVVFFVGRVRDTNLDQSVSGLYLEHYSGMTEKVLNDILTEARQRWDVIAVKIIHRIGQLGLGDQIVFVGVASAHRSSAFQAAEFLMDFLKTQAPFWKKELNSRGDLAWLDAQEKDEVSSQRW